MIIPVSRNKDTEKRQCSDGISESAHLGIVVHYACEPYDLSQPLMTLMAKKNTKML